MNFDTEKNQTERTWKKTILMVTASTIILQTRFRSEMYYRVFYGCIPAPKHEEYNDADTNSILKVEALLFYFRVKTFGTK